MIVLKRGYMETCFKKKTPSLLIASLSLDPWPLQRITILPQHLKEELQNKAVVGRIK